MQDLADARENFMIAREIGQNHYNDGFSEDGADLFLVSIDYSLGDFETAVSAGLQTLRRPAKRMGGRNRTILCATIGAALASVGRMAEAEEMLRTTIQQAKRALGSTIWVFNHVACLVARQGRYGDAAQLLGYVDAAPTSGFIAKSPSQAQSYAQAQAAAKAALDTDAFKDLHSAGAHLSEHDAMALAFPLEH
jgi:hypothetical protein